MTSFDVTTHVRTELLDITDKVKDAVAQSKIASGMCFVYVPHTTAAVTVNESCDADVASDITAALSKLVPHRAGYAHSEGNSDAHIKAAMVGSCQAIPVEEGRLALGRWQGVFFCEFDGPRQRRVQVQVINERGTG
jgi:secondary thiamine-phosphate synthase enzyme